MKTISPAHSTRSPEALDTNTVLRTEGLSKSFGRDFAVRDLNLHLRKGEIYGFLGRNGAGKTTTIRMLMGILKPAGGAMHFFAETGKVRRNASFKQQIGYVSQEQFFYPWMTCRNIGRFVGGFYKTWNHHTYDDLLAKLDLPPGRKVAALSHGMKTKLALALALAHSPRLLILDEPTAGLDPVTRRDFLEMILAQKRNHGRTIFFSTHLLEDVERTADTIGVITKGHMRYEGPLEEMKRFVRKVTPEGDAPPEEARLVEAGLQLLRKDSREETPFWYAAATDEIWSKRLPGYRVETLPLEEVFVELSGKALLDL